MEDIIMMLKAGERIREIRNNKNLTGSWLAKQIGVSQSFISALETGQKHCSLETLFAITQALDISMSDFFAAEQPLPDPQLQRLLNAVEKLNEFELEKLVEFVESLNK
jgi:transcriptional regulator with XRE-family HTH domain